MLKLEALDMLFNKFDEDGNGTLELSEVLTMFRENGFNVSEAALEQIYLVVTKVKPFKMSLEQFKQLMLSNIARKCFHDIMFQVKKREQSRLCDQADKKVYFPMNLNAMLNHLYMRMKHEALFEEIKGAQVANGDEHAMK